MKFSTVLTAVLICAPVTLAIVTPPRIAQAADASAVLEKLDRDAQAFKDTSYVSTMEIWKNGSKKKTLQFDMVMKGLDKQLINFTAPGDVAGMKILMVGDSLWMYSPEFQKVRMIAAHTHLPVFGVPVRSSALSGLDSLLSIVQMPRGVPVGTLAIGEAGAANAGLLAAAVLALTRPELRARLLAFRREQTEAAAAATLPTPTFEP